MPEAARPGEGAAVPEELAANLLRYFGEAGREFAAGVPGRVEELATRWSLRVGPALLGARTAWVAPCLRADGSDAILRIGYPEFASGGEAEALRSWQGRGSVRLLDSDRSRNALLLERCLPGTPLSVGHDVDEVLGVAAGLLRRLWRGGTASSSHARLSTLAEQRASEAERRRGLRPEGLDAALVAEAIGLWRQLPGGNDEVLLHADFHPRNVLAAGREPWLAIDPKPLLGDPAYEPVPLVLEAGASLGPEEVDRAGWSEEIGRRVRVVSRHLDLEAPRVAAWGLARSVDWALFLSERGEERAARRAAVEARAFAAAV
jgi:streptomycin 6-kinase